jgi:hypothetical protein
MTAARAFFVFVIIAVVAVCASLALESARCIRRRYHRYRVGQEIKALMRERRA